MSTTLPSAGHSFEAMNKFRPLRPIAMRNVLRVKREHLATAPNAPPGWLLDLSLALTSVGAVVRSGQIPLVVQSVSHHAIGPSAARVSSRVARLASARVPPEAPSPRQAVLPRSARMGEVAPAVVAPSPHRRTKSSTVPASAPRAFSRGVRPLCSVRLMPNTRSSAPLAPCLEVASASDVASGPRRVGTSSVVSAATRVLEVARTPSASVSPSSADHWSHVPARTLKVRKVAEVVPAPLPVRPSPTYTAPPSVPRAVERVTRRRPAVLAGRSIPVSSVLPGFLLMRRRAALASCPPLQSGGVASVLT